MRSMHNGVLAFGLVSLNTKLYSATEEGGIPHHQVHSHDGGKIRYKRTCETCNEAVSAADIATLYEVDGQTATLTDDDLAEIQGEKSRAIEVLEFVPNTIDPIRFDGSYLVGPADKNSKPYALLVHTLQASGLVAIVRFTMRGKNRLAMMTVTGKSVLVLHCLRWSDEIREPEVPNIPDVELSEAEIAMAAQVVESMTSPSVNLDKYRDESREELRELVLSKIGGEGAEEVSDLLAKLEKSVEKKCAAHPDKIRKWARSNGLTVGDRGRIPADIVDRYQEAVA